MNYSINDQKCLVPLTDLLLPTENIILPVTLSNGYIVFYDRGEEYGEYSLNNGILTRLSEGTDDESKTSNNWRFLICDNLITGIGSKTYDVGGFEQSYGLGQGLTITNNYINIIQGWNDEYKYESIIYNVYVRREAEKIKWFIPTKDELELLFSIFNNIDISNKPSSPFFCYTSSKHFDYGNPLAVKSDLSGYDIGASYFLFMYRQ